MRFVIIGNIFLVNIMGLSLPLRLGWRVSQNGMMDREKIPALDQYRMSFITDLRLNFDYFHFFYVNYMPRITH